MIEIDVALGVAVKRKQIPVGATFVEFFGRVVEAHVEGADDVDFVRKFAKGGVEFVDVALGGPILEFESDHMFDLAGLFILFGLAGVGGKCAEGKRDQNHCAEQ
jgi:hypothetical protein